MDHLGSVRDLTGATGTPIGRYSFDPWGRPIVSSGSEPIAPGFTGHEAGEPAGVWLTAFRPYSADLGRFLSSDPIGLAGGLNQYKYPANNPIAFIDPLGLKRLTFQQVTDPSWLRIIDRASARN